MKLQIKTGAGIAGIFLVLAACGSAGADQPASTSAPTTAASPAATQAAPAPDSTPEAVWSWDGATGGTGAVEFLGAHELAVGAAAFDGYTGHGITATPGPLDTTKSFSVAAWVNYADTELIAAAASQLGVQTGIFQLGVGEDNWWFMMKTEDRTGLEYSVSAQGAPATPSTSWTHLVGVYDDADGVLRLFVDGALAAEAEFNAPLPAPGPLAIGRAQFDGLPGNFWPGAIASVAAYQNALNADHIAQIYGATKPASPAPPMAAPDPSTYADGLLTGTWDFTLDGEGAEFILENFAGLVDGADEVAVRLGFDEHEYWQGFVFDGELFLLDGSPEGDVGTIFIDGEVLVLSSSAQMEGVFLWSLEGDSLTLTMVAECNLATQEPTCTEIREEMDPITLLVWEHSYSKTSDDPSY